MSLRFKDTLSGEIKDFVPLTPKKVSIYCCGVTVYDSCHLGHARSYIVWDVLRRYLIWKGYEVTFVQNFTDIDDKILNRALEEGSNMKEVSEKNIKAFHRDMDELGILRPDKMPRATNYIQEICKLIQDLQLKGKAYSVDGDVYFAVIKHAEYGKLSGRLLDQQKKNAEGRLQKQEEKRKKESFDFALWKSAKEGEPSFQSPWGKGRPGWHIECSAMVRAELGNTIDIHLGGADLVFPHHENEIAQSESANGEELARYWLHNGMVNVGGMKMSKSLGNFTTIRSLLEKGISPMSLRLFILQAHYRKPLDFTEKAILSASNAWNGLNSVFCLVNNYKDTLKWPIPEETCPNLDISKSRFSNDKSLKDQYDKFIELMDNDINTAGAISILFEISKPLKKLVNKLDIGEVKGNNQQQFLELYPRWQTLIDLAAVLGLKKENSNKTNNQKSEDNPFRDQQSINAAIELRRQAKVKHDFAKADQIRDELFKNGIQLFDQPNGLTNWKRI